MKISRKIIVMSSMEAFSQRANAIHTVKMADGFSELGNEVVILCHRSPDKKKAVGKDLSRFYGICPAIRWIQIPNHFFGFETKKDFLFPLIAFWVTLWQRPDLVYARSFFYPCLTSGVRIPTTVESHSPADKAPFEIRQLINISSRSAFKLWITISEVLVAQYHALGAPLEKLAVMPTGADFKNFRRPEVLPPSPYPTKGRRVAAYMGHLYDYKGIPTILEAAALLSDIDFHLIGGLEDDLNRHRAAVKNKKIKNVFFHGMKRHAELPPYLWHADVLLLPPSALHPSAAWTSPVKVGEYLSSETPMVVSDIPALRSWLKEDEVVFVDPDKGQALASGIREVFTGKNIISRAARLKKAEQFSYSKRAQEILSRVFCQKEAALTLEKEFLEISA